MREAPIWFRFGKYGMGLQLKAPWHFKYFSEREGIERPIVALLGWRLFYLKPLRLGQ